MSNILKVFESIKNTGGASYNFSTGILNPDTGWMVGTAHNERQIPMPENLHNFGSAVNDYLRSLSYNDRLHIDVLMENESLYLGFWFHEGKLFIDISEWYQWFSEAIVVAQNNDQIAMWDCTHKHEFKIKN